MYESSIQLYPVSPHAKFRLLTEMPNLGSTPFAQGTAVQLYTNLRLWRRPGQGGLGGLGTSTCVKPDMYSQHLNRRLRLRTLAHPGPGSPLAADELLAIIYSR